MNTKLFIIACQLITITMLSTLAFAEKQRTPEQTFDPQGKYIYDKPRPKQRYEEAQREMERDERQHEIDRERDNAEKKK